MRKAGFSLCESDPERCLGKCDAVWGVCSPLNKKPCNSTRPAHVNSIREVTSYMIYFNYETKIKYTERVTGAEYTDTQCQLSGIRNRRISSFR